MHPPVLLLRCTWWHGWWQSLQDDAGDAGEAGEAAGKVGKVSAVSAVSACWQGCWQADAGEGKGKDSAVSVSAVSATAGSVGKVGGTTATNTAGMSAAHHPRRAWTAGADEATASAASCATTA